MSAEPLSPTALFELVLLLLALVIPLEIVARRLRLPPAAAQILAGIGLTFVPFEHPVHLDPDLILVLFLPPLLMSSAFLTVWRDFRSNAGVIAALAVGAVAFTTAAVGVVAHLLLPTLPWAACFTLGAILSPPDALAAKAVLSRVALPARMTTLLEGESLVNDASGLVLFRLAVAATLTGTFSIADAAVSFVSLSVGGTLIGLFIGWLAIFLLARLRDPAIFSIGTLLTAWAAYIIADRLGVSGVLSTVACGILIGWRQHTVLPATHRITAGAVWQATEFVLESLVFVLIGLSLRNVRGDSRIPFEQILPAVAGVVAMLVVSRFVWIYGTSYARFLFTRRWAARPPASALAVMSWAGMRGVVSLAIALSLPEGFPGQEFILLATFASILVTVLLQGSTLAPLIRLVHLRDPAERPPALLTEVEARLQVAEAQAEAVRKLAYDADGTLRHPRLMEQYEYRREVMSRVREAQGGMPAERTAHFDLIVAAVTAGRAALLDMHRKGTIHDSVLNTLERELDLEELTALRRRGPGGPE